MKTLFNVSLTTGLLFLGAFAQAEDVYNFYFQKAKGANTVIQSKNGQQVNPGKTVTENLEEESVYVEPQEEVIEETLVRTKRTMPKREKSALKRWSVGAGVGGLSTSQRDPYVDGEIYNDGIINVKGYTFQANYRISRYFDIEGIVLIDRDARGDNEKEIAGSLGIGLDPLHLKIFGRELLTIGAVGGVMRGNREEWFRSDNKTSVFLGSRVAVKLSDSISVVGAYKFDTKFPVYTQSSLTMNYNW